MNIENEKISSRQVSRLLFYDFFALPALLLPGILAKNSGMDGFFALAAGIALGYLFLLAVLVWVRRMQVRDTAATAWLALLYAVFGIFGAAYAMQLLCKIVRTYFIRDTPVWLVMGALAILAVYGLEAGMESLGRMYELIFWFVLVPLLLLCVCAASAVQPEHWIPVARTSGASLIKNSACVFAFFAGSASLPTYAACIADQEALSGAIKRSYVFGGLLVLALFLLLTGIFGVSTVAVMEEPILQLTALAKTSGGFFERQDALLCMIWFIGVFAFVENALYRAVWSMQRLGKQRAKQWYVFGSGFAAAMLALLLYRRPALLHWLGQAVFVSGVPLLVLLVLCAAFFRCVRQEKKEEMDDEK